MEINDIIQIEYDLGEKLAQKVEALEYTCNCFTDKDVLYFKTTVDDEGVCDHCGYYAVKKVASEVQEYDESFYNPPQNNDNLEKKEATTKWNLKFLDYYNRFGPFPDKIANFEGISTNLVFKRLKKCGSHIKSLFSKENQIKYILIQGYLKFGPDRKRIQEYFGITEKTLVRYLNQYNLNHYYNARTYKKFETNVMKRINKRLYH